MKGIAINDTTGNITCRIVDQILQQCETNAREKIFHVCTYILSIRELRLKTKIKLYIMIDKYLAKRACNNELHNEDHRFDNIHWHYTATTD